MRVDIQNKTFFKKALNETCSDLKASEFLGISIDSRNIKPGDIFLAFQGESVDGHNYISQAKNAGASIAIIEREVKTSLPSFQTESTQQFLHDLAFAYRNQITCPFIGITGSN